jgi:hypothetical protein
MARERRPLTIVAEVTGVVGTVVGIVFGVIALVRGEASPPPAPQPQSQVRLQSQPQPQSQPQSQPQLQSQLQSPLLAQTPGGGTAAEAGRVVPMRLKDPDFKAYCEATGQGTAYLDPAKNDAYGWTCSAPTIGGGDDAQAVCVWSNGGATAITNRVADFKNPRSWQCWASNGELGPLDWDAYCRDRGLGRAQDNGTNDAYTWTCTGSTGALDSQDACLVLYGSSPPISRFQDFYDKNSWQCWG